MTGLVTSVQTKLTLHPSAHINSLSISKLILHFLLILRLQGFEEYHGLNFGLGKSLDKVNGLGVQIVELRESEEDPYRRP